MSGARLFRLTRFALLMAAVASAVAILNEPLPAHPNAKWVLLWATSLPALAMVLKEQHDKEVGRG